MTSPIQTATATLHTNRGDIKIALFGNHAPKTVANFVGLAQGTKDYSTENASGGTSGPFYDGVVFHRVIDGFMIQGGGFTADLKQKPTRAPIPLEASNGLKNDKYTIAMARTGNPDSATSQFFINVKNNDSLNAPSPDGYGYTVFGKVVSGTDVVDKIRAVQTGNKGGMQNVPVEPITIQSATVVAK